MPGGTGMPRLVISARPAPLPPSSSFIVPLPSALPSPKKYTYFAMALLVAMQVNSSRRCRASSPLRASARYPPGLHAECGKSAVNSTACQQDGDTFRSPWAGSASRPVNQTLRARLVAGPVEQARSRPRSGTRRWRAPLVERSEQPPTPRCHPPPRFARPWRVSRSIKPRRRQPVARSQVRGARTGGPSSSLRGRSAGMGPQGTARRDAAVPGRAVPHVRHQPADWPGLIPTAAGSRRCS
jgi:hypothetical protein